MSLTASDHSSVSRLQLIEWLNDEFELSVDKIEQCGTGAVYLLIVDKLFWSYQSSKEYSPIPMQRVRWDTETSYDFEDNYKILQKVFNNFNVAKHIPVQQLSKGRMQDNLIFLHFLHNLFLKYYKEDPTYPGGWNRRSISTHKNFKPWALPKYGENMNPSSCRNVDNASKNRVNASGGRNTVGGTNNGGSSSAIRKSQAMAVRPGASSNHMTKTSPAAVATKSQYNSVIPSRTPYQRVPEQKKYTDILENKVKELEKTLEDADIDINLLNNERAKYYVQLLSIEKLRMVREELHGGNQPCITPNEILSCIDGVKYPDDISQFVGEFDYKLYILESDDVNGN